ncbi:DUF397 domain-containing protein [Streptomyces carpaticus]|uniref:DUF397 domain-containing protein n=1 Tax=Streptomyces harbinensis TaxID=1176198 RepID=A0A1I6PPJ4_9ACTN|nr:DUF397 domain-containing protein [Streptomyces harbinensis]UWM51874.1 DUF397 domain-containing protein [Streptomyces carpaticus]SFS42117.1 protein of unknown function [Streptomyces harbinensis]
MTNALTWFKSSYSGSEGGACVEVARPSAHTIRVRDSKNPAGPVLTVRPDSWTAFASAVAGDRVSPP